MNHKEKSRTLHAFNVYRSILQFAMDNPFIWDEGEQWYKNAHTMLREMSSDVGLDLDVVAGVTAVLSPLTGWNRNLNGTRRLIDAYKRDLPPEWMKVYAERYTAYNKNARKAVALLSGDASTDVISGKKVRPFWHNLSGRLDYVTIDRHMFNVVDRFGLQSPTPTGNAQRALTRATQMCGSMFNIPPAHAQAIIWVAYRDHMHS